MYTNTMLMRHNNLHYHYNVSALYWSVALCAQSMVHYHHVSCTLYRYIVAIFLLHLKISQLKNKSTSWISFFRPTFGIFIALAVKWENFHRKFLETDLWEYFHRPGCQVDAVSGIWISFFRPTRGRSEEFSSPWLSSGRSEWNPRTGFT